ncbi:MAG TPA: histidine kinase, partial [Saprospiraceae bacterium]|nr:histidine kinase [Saprospiraceae bacterium]
DIYSMVSTPDGQVWLGTDDGISICSFHHDAKSVKKLGLKDGLPDQIITKLKVDSTGNIYIGTFESGLTKYDQQQKKIIPLFENTGLDEITALEIFDGREVWIGTRTSGVWRYMQGWKSPRKMEILPALKTINITDLLTDVEGNMWITMDKGGLISGFRPFESLSCAAGEIQALFCDHANQVWIGSKKGLYILANDHAGTGQVVRIQSQYDLSITDILEDQFNRLWIATLDKGLFVFDPATNKMTSIGSIIGRGGITIMSMAKAKEKIWLATLEGVMSFPVNVDILKNKTEFQLLSDPWQSNLHFIYQVFVDSKNRTWFATDGNGVFCNDGNQIRQYSGNKEFPLHKVYSIAEDHRGHLWFNTPDLGLVEFDGSDYKGLNLAQGLGSQNISSILSAGNGDFVVTHSHGIDIMEPDRRHFMYYGGEIGAKEIEPGLNSIALDNDQNVYIGCNNKIYKYFSSHKKLSIDPRTLITKVMVFEEPIDFSNTTHFRHSQNYFTFDYVGLWYTSPSSVKYQYKLEGYDIQWKESKDNVASYSHLSPGDYTFYVKASENNSFFDEPIASYSFTISKPFVLKPWFLSLVIVTAVSLLWMLIKSREKRSERQALLKKEMVESQLSALKAQINPHFLFNSFNTLITIIDENAKNPDVAIEYVEKLADFYRSILQYREQDSITLEEEFELVRNFTYLLEKRYGSHLRLHMDKPLKDAYILPLTLQMLVENAVKHNIITAKKPLDVYISMEDNEYVSVTNNLQPKSNSEPSTQFGLPSIIKQYQLLSDHKVIIEDGPDVFKVRIPVIKRTGI